MKAKDLEESIANIDSVQPAIKNVEAAFARISQQGDYFSVHHGNALARWLYTMSGENNNSGYQNHFQGIQRLKDKNYLVISGGDWRNSKSDLFIIKMGSRPAKGAWWSNITTNPDAPEEDIIISAIELDDKNWHAGGMDVQGNILAVPIEYSPPDTIKKLFGIEPPDHGNEESSKVLFFDLTDPESPKKFPFEINRKRAKAGGVALTQLPSGHFLVAVWTDSDKLPKRLEFYLSKTKKFKDGFLDKCWTWFPDDVFAVGKQDRNFSDFQTINFVLQKDGRLYLIGLHNTASMAPVLGGRDYADLFEVELANNSLQQNPAINPNDKPKITKVANLRFDCKNRQCNFDGGAGIYIDDGDLFVYSTFHYRGIKGIVKFNEYLPPYRGVSGELNNNLAWIEMFQQTHFLGRRLAIRDTKNMTQPNFDHVKAQKEGFEDETFSIRFQLPKDSKCLLYEHKDFKKILPLKLTGTGGVVELPMLADNIKGKISSMKFLS